MDFPLAVILVGTLMVAYGGVRSGGLTPGYRDGAPAWRLNDWMIAGMVSQLVGVVSLAATIVLHPA